MDPEEIKTQNAEAVLTEQNQTAEPIPYTADELLELPRENLGTLDSKRLAETSPHVLALFLERVDVDDRRIVLRKVSIEYAAEILAEMNGEAAAEVLEAMRERRAVRILEDFEPDDAADIVAELDEEDRTRLLGKVDRDTARTVTTLLSYDPDTAGGVMTPEVDTLSDAMSVDQAIAHIREWTEAREDMNWLYVVDEAHRLVGSVNLRQLIRSRPGQLIREIMDDDLSYTVTPETDREKVALKMAEFNVSEIPVVSQDGTMLGVVTHDDVIDIMREEATEDIQVMSGAGADEGIHDHVFYSVKRRLPWLEVNLFTASIAAAVVICFRHQIGQMPLLAGLMPIVAGIGGNSGQQALAVTIRSMALGEIHDADTREVFFKQLLVGILNGLGVGLVASILFTLFSHNYMVGVVLMMATVANMTLGGVTGTAIPLIMRRLNRDPAQSSSIILTAVTDTGGFFIFLSLGTMFLLN